VQKEGVNIRLSTHINKKTFASLALIGILIESKHYYYSLLGEFGRHTNDSEKYCARKWREISFKFETDVVPSPDRYRISLREVIL
jgi:hypothetical protein